MRNGGLYLMTAVAVALPALLAGIFGTWPVRIPAWIVVVGLVGLGVFGEGLQRWCFTF